MIKRYIKLIVGFALLATAGLTTIGWFVCRIYVPPEKCAVLIRKMGEALPPGQLVATKSGQRGIQADVLGPGRHFRDPLRYQWELKDLTVIPSGDPATWEWIHSLDKAQRDQLRAGRFAFKGKFPQIGVVTRKVGLDPEPGQTIVTRDSGKRGILREVLTPGTYKINPYIYDVELHPAVVIPAGFVGVVTNLFGEQPETTVSAGLSELAHGGKRLADRPASDAETDVELVEFQARALAKSGQRGTLADVLQPGVYFINPKLQKVTPIEIGFNEYSQVKLNGEANYRISFPSDTGYLIRVGVTVVWGIHPQNASSIINEFGNVDGVLDKVIGPRLRSICRNIGSTYAARDFIQGEKREKFQQEMTKELQRVCSRNNVEVLLALVREIEVHAPRGGEDGDEVTEDLKRTIQQSYIAIEKQLTKEKQREAATVKAQLEEIRKQVDIAQETVKAETRVMVANIAAGAEKQAAEVDAQAALEVATIQQQVALLDAQRIEILGRARTDVDKMKRAADAEGYRLLVQAFGSPQAYNLYTFAESFEPQSIQLFYAGEGTFWTDLERFDQVGAAKIMRMPDAKTEAP